MNTTLKIADRGDTTRQALIDAALIEFSRNGYHAASNREIARHAQANQALIGYHFGGKEGLYLAVFQHICEKIQGHIGSYVNEIEAQLSGSVGEAGQEECLVLLLRLVEGMARLFVSPAMSAPAQLIMYEQQEPTKAFDILYDGFMRRSLDVVDGLVMRIRPEFSREEASLTVAAILGQVLVFRAAKTTLLRHFEWDEIGQAQFETLLKQIKANVRAILCSME